MKVFNHTPDVLNILQGSEDPSPRRLAAGEDADFPEVPGVLELRDGDELRLVGAPDPSQLGGGSGGSDQPLIDPGDGSGGSDQPLIDPGDGSGGNDQPLIDPGDGSGDLAAGLGFLLLANGSGQPLDIEIVRTLPSRTAYEIFGAVDAVELSGEKGARKLRVRAPSGE